MRRFFIDRDIKAGQKVTLGGDEAKHILTVLRMKAGDELILINGSGVELTARITETGRDGVGLDIISEAPCAAEPRHRVTLFQCLPKAGKLEFVIQKCVELGVSEIQPVLSRRCVAGPDMSAGRLARFERISHEAAKQCGRGTAPRVLPVKRLAECDFSGFGLVLAAYEGETETTLKSVLRENADAENIAIVIGPEGGFESGEVDAILASSASAHSVSLGKRILRTETAGMAMLAAVMYELED